MVKKSISRKVKRRTAARKAARQPREWGWVDPPAAASRPSWRGEGAKIENSSGSPPSVDHDALPASAPSTMCIR